MISHGTLSTSSTWTNTSELKPLILRASGIGSTTGWSRKSILRALNTSKAMLRTSMLRIARYSRMLSEAPMDVAFVGFGENGHIAFNDPYSAT